MNAPIYHSVLFCFHPGHTDLFYDGLPVGVVRDGKFVVHTFSTADGKGRPAEVPDNIFLPGVALDAVGAYLDAEEAKKTTP